MGAHVEWLDAKYTKTRIVPAGGKLGISEGKLGLILSADEVVVLEGTVEEIGDLLHHALVQLGPHLPPVERAYNPPLKDLSVVVTVEHGAGKTRRYVVAREDQSLFQDVPAGTVPVAQGTPALGGETRPPSVSDIRLTREQHLGRFSFGCQWLRSLGKVDEMYRTLSTWEVVKVERIDSARVWGNT